jgi:crossover junction endodeoxyribonuclease RuvC
LRILGIDPGTADTGFGVIETAGGRTDVLTYGSIKTSSKLEAGDRLVQICDRLQGLIDTYEPEVMVVEKLFFSKNERTALAVGRTVGVVLLCAAQRKLPTVEYTPNEVKLAVVGYGGAEKKQVQYMVARILRLDEIPKPDDAADALALCICHAHSARIRGLSGRSG